MCIRDRHIAVRTPPAYQRGRLPRALPGYPVRSLILKRASHLDAFSAYPFRRWPTSRALGRTTGTPELRPSRSSRTRAVSYTHLDVYKRQDKDGYVVLIEGTRDSPDPDYKPCSQAITYKQIIKERTAAGYILAQQKVVDGSFLLKFKRSL